MAIFFAIKITNYFAFILLVFSFINGVIVAKISV